MLLTYIQERKVGNWVFDFKTWAEAWVNKKQGPFTVLQSIPAKSSRACDGVSFMRSDGQGGRVAQPPRMPWKRQCPSAPLLWWLSKEINKTRLEPCAAEMKLEISSAHNVSKIRFRGIMISRTCFWLPSNEANTDILWCCFPPWVDLFNFSWVIHYPWLCVFLLCSWGLSHVSF